MPSTLKIEPYKPIPEKIVVPEHLMEETIESFLEKHAVIWIAGKRYQSSLAQTVPENATAEETVNENQEGSVIKKRKRTIFHLWYKTFRCHRAGEKETKANRESGGNSGQLRPIQKNTKKIGCLATMRIHFEKCVSLNLFFFIGFSLFNHMKKSLSENTINCS